jgi:membrane-associated phospholipid phosphatase
MGIDVIEGANLAERSLAVRWAAAGVACLVIGAILGVIAAGNRVIPVELDAMLLVQQFGGNRLDDFAWIMSRLGDALPSLLLVSLLAAAVCALCGREDLALVVLAASAARGFGPLLKWLFASPRPPVDVVAVLEQTDGFGYPSGHAIGATLVYGTIALVAGQAIENRVLRFVVQAVAMALVVLVALSRVRLGVHWISDIAGGLIFGVGILCLIQAGLQTVEERRLRT